MVNTLLVAVLVGGVACLGYALVLYPLVAAAGCYCPATSRPAHVLGDGDAAWSVSLIIPAHNEAEVLAAKLQNALALDYPKEQLEIVVVSDGSTDGTVEIARSYAADGIQVLDLQPNRGKASALNAGVAYSRGEVLCLCDANVMFRPDALRKLVARLADPAVGAVSGDVRLASEESDFEAGERTYYRLERWIQLGESRMGSMLGVDGGMYVIRKELFQPLPPDTILDDFVTSMRVIQQGKRIVYEPEAIATENGTPTWQQEFRRRVRVTMGAVQSIQRGMWPPLSRPIELWQYVSHKLLRWLGPLWLLMAFASSACLWGEGWAFQAAFLTQAGFYALAGAAWVSPRWREFRPAGVAFYFTISHIAMAVGWWKGLVSRPTGRWERTPRTPAAVLAAEHPQAHSAG